MMVKKASKTNYKQEYLAKFKQRHFRVFNAFPLNRHIRSKISKESRPMRAEGHALDLIFNFGAIYTHMHGSPAMTAIN